MPSSFRLATIAALFTAALVSAVPINDPNSNPSVLQKRAGGATVIYRCTIPGTIAITFDDGPFLYTNGLLDILKSRNVKATFFFNGNNYGRIEDFAPSVKRAYQDGHQVASHTWDHKDLTTLSPPEALEELTKLEDAFRKIIGVRPTYVRPPFAALNQPVLDLLGQRNYTAVLWSQDTMDWAHPDDFSASYKLYEQLFNNTETLGQPGHIVLQHEVNQVTALQVAPMAIDLALVKGYKVVTVGECLGDPKSNWYIN
ncbi:polysaccharide deacetylase [Linnemannia elongata]|nr:polysaccharide deacetylase [Linnemannia elongata]